MMTILQAQWPASWPASWSAPLGLLAIFVGVAICSAILTRLVMGVMGQLRLHVRDNSQSSHQGSPLLGGGWSVIGLTLGFWSLSTILLIGPLTGPQIGYQLTVVLGAFSLAMISWFDDLRPIPPLPRLIAQGAAVCACLFMLPGDDAILWRGFPLEIDRLLAGLFWIWFINLYNFLDGIDSLAASEAISITVGILLVGLLVKLEPSLLVLAAMLGGAMAGFLPWNWHPSRILLGDLGAIPGGFLLGLLLLHLALQGQLVAALILPLYFLADASATLIGRLYRAEPVWRSHRQHFYQRALAGESRHDRIVMWIVVVNIILVVLAVFSIWYPEGSILLALGIVAVLLYRLHHLAGK